LRLEMAQSISDKQMLAVGIVGRVTRA